MAVGLGSEKARYEPESFPALTYVSESADVPVFVWWYDVMIAVGQTETECTAAIKSARQRLENIGLADDVAFENEVSASKVSELIAE
jgi:TATA-box binding protein (TBP) (component of TFIID and TFIIIB)